VSKINIVLAAEIINRHFAANGFGHIVVDPGELDWDGYIEEWDLIASNRPFEDFGTKLFEFLSLDKSKEEQILYHFKPASTARLILNDRAIQASYLPAHSSNDAEEYMHFMKQMGHPLATGRPVPPKILQKLGEIQTIEQIREQVFILCFTRTNTNERFWKEYADNNSGVCFKFRFKPIEKNIALDVDLIPLYSLREMIYDLENDTRFSFIEVMNKELKDKVGYELQIAPVPKFAMHSKRNCKAWEDEVRFGIDMGYLRARNSTPDYLIIQEDGSREYIRIRIKGKQAMLLNPLPFELELLEVQCGGNMDPETFKDIERIVNRNYPGVEIMKYN
jgi:hypothetical protein